MNNVSWSGTLTLVMLWVIGPLIYLGMYIVKRLKQRRLAKTTIANKESNEDHSEDALNAMEYESKGTLETLDESKGENDNGEGEDNWTSIQYLFGLVGYAIGIGNVWRFCYVIARDGGAASLFAYIVCTIFVGTPLFMYEMIVGQYLRLHAYNAWTFIKPRWEGLAMSQFVMVLLVQSYFVMIIGYTVPYMIGSCQDPLPWTEHSAGSEGYWFENVLGLKEVQSVTDNNTVVLEEVETFALKWDLVGSLLFTWIVVFLSTSFGKTILANVTYVTVLAPFALMAILIVRTATLPGAIDGIRYYIGKFDTKKLGDFQVWASALSQCLFSLSPGFATAITMSAMTDKHEDVHRAAIITSTANTVFAIASGFAIFAMIGNIAHDTGRSVEAVASTGGQGLAFIVVASAMPTFGNATNIMSAMFFFMLFTLGLDSSFCWQETLNATVEDLLGRYAGLDKDRRPPSWIISLVTCSFCFVIGLPYATTRGNLILDGIDFYVGTTFLLFVCFLEIIILNFDFGWKRLEYALQKATLGKKTLRSYIQCCRFDFHVAIPIATLGLFLYQFVDSIRTPYLPNNPGIEILSWTLFGICTALLFWGVWKQGDGKLETLEMPLDEYPWGREYWTTLENSDENHGQEQDEMKSMP